MTNILLKSIDRIGTGDVITLGRGTLALVLEPMYGEDLKCMGFTIAAITQKEYQFQGDPRSDDYIMMPRAVKHDAGISNRHQYPVSIRPEFVTLDDCLQQGMDRDVICHGRIPRRPFVETLFEKIGHIGGYAHSSQVRKTKTPTSKETKKAYTPTISVADACKIGVLYPVFNDCVRSHKPDHTVTLEELHKAAQAFQKNPKDNTLRNLIDMQKFPADFLLEHARERGILTDSRAIQELRGQGVHTLPVAFAVAQVVRGHVSGDTLDHLNTQPYAKIAEVIIQGRRAFLTKVGTSRDTLRDVQVLSV